MTGLVGSGTVTLSPVDHSTKCLRHQSNNMILTDCSALTSDLHRQDATFYVVAGWFGASQGYISLQSYNYPTSFIRHSGFNMITGTVNAASSALFKQDASFLAELVSSG